MPKPKLRRIRAGEIFNPQIHIDRRSGEERRVGPSTRRTGGKQPFSIGPDEFAVDVEKTATPIAFKPTHQGSGFIFGKNMRHIRDRRSGRDRRKKPWEKR